MGYTAVDAQSTPATDAELQCRPAAPIHVVPSCRRSVGNVLVNVTA